MKTTASIIIPTWNNPQFLNPCIDSIIGTGALRGLCNLIIVNNGQQPVKDYVKGISGIEVLEPGENLGWERGLEYGLKHTDAEYVCFQNDDTNIPKATQSFYSQLLWPFQDDDVAAIGPTTTIASGWHSIFNKNHARWLMEVPYLIFFTVMMRRRDLIAAGGIDTSAPGGDDFDLSIRLRKLGKKLLINPDAFLIHHAFKTGTRVRGESHEANGWNSKEMTDRTNQWLIRKHGFSTFMDTMRGFDYKMPSALPDTEGEICASLVEGDLIVELGCGFRKTVPNAVGVDRADPNKAAPHIGDQGCVADVKADVTETLPFAEFSVDTVIARHILEHCIDPVKTLRHWNEVLKLDGRMIIAVPNQEKNNTIPLNPEHVHAYTPESLKNLLDLCGFKQIDFVDPKNGISFVACFEKVSHCINREPIGELSHA